MQKALVILGCLMVSAVHAQTDQIIQITPGTYSIEKVIGEIESQTDFTFSYSSNTLSSTGAIELSKDKNTLDELLNRISETCQCRYQLKDRKILLFKNSDNSEKRTVSGYVKDSDSNEALIGVTLYDEQRKTGAVTNVYGFFSYTYQGNTPNLRVSYVGYQDQKISISNDNQPVDILLTPQAGELDEVVVTASRTAENQMSKMSVQPKEIKNLPRFMGEPDIIKTMTLMPGIKSGNDNSGGFYVRGGGPDQNLILVDGAIIYNSSHAFDLFSTFNADAIKHVDMYKGGFPARYGGRVSSIMDVRLREGNMQRYTGEIGLGYLLSKATIEGPIIKDKASFLLSGRRTFIDLPLKMIGDLDGDPNAKLRQNIVFQDLTAKTNFKVSDKDHMYLSFYSSGDAIWVDEGTKVTHTDGSSGFIGSEVDVAWANKLASFRWNHTFNNKLFFNFNSTYTLFDLGIAVKNKTEGSPDVTSSFTNAFHSKIRDYGFKTQFDYFANQTHKIKFGTNSIFHRFEPGIGQLSTVNGTSKRDTTFRSAVLYSNESSVFVEDEIALTSRLQANLGVHGSMLFVDNTTYQSLQPRISASYKINPLLKVNLSYASMMQFIHLLTNSAMGIPLDLWVPATSKAPPSTSRQLAGAFNFDFQKGYFLSLEGYYKTMNNLIAYQEGANFTDAKVSWDQKIHTDGNSNSYGAELFLKKNIGKTTGWVGYTLSRTNRKFTKLNGGNAYPYKYDRRHDASVVASHKINKKINLSGSWIYGTGNAATFPVASHRTLSLLPNLGYNRLSSIVNQSVEHYDGRNNARLPAYHRLDLGINFEKAKKRGVRTWNFSIYNAYGKKNAFAINMSAVEGSERPYQPPGQGTYKELRQVSAFWFVPSFSYNFKFN
ncbi:MAG: TonB-dependent receptor [Cyclobacteriaceae bacterium]